MPEKRQRSHDPEPSGEDPKRDWAEDQEKRRYYYDDAHGYEVFDPDEPDREEQEEGDEQ